MTDDLTFLQKIGRAPLDSASKFQYNTPRRKRNEPQLLTGAAAMPNRIALAIARQQASITQRITANLVTPAKVEACRKSLDMELGEYCRFQELKSLAVIDGRLTQEEGGTVYNYLGNTPTVFNAQSAAVKAVLTNLFSELLKSRIDAARPPYSEAMAETIKGSNIDGSTPH